MFSNPSSHVGQQEAQRKREIGTIMNNTKNASIHMSVKIHDCDTNQYNIYMYQLDKIADHHAARAASTQQVQPQHGFISLHALWCSQRSYNRDRTVHSAQLGDCPHSARIAFIQLGQPQNLVLLLHSSETHHRSLLFCAKFNT